MSAEGDRGGLCPLPLSKFSLPSLFSVRDKRGLGMELAENNSWAPFSLVQLFHPDSKQSRHKHKDKSLGLFSPRILCDTALGLQSMLLTFMWECASNLIIEYTEYITRMHYTKSCVWGEEEGNKKPQDKQHSSSTIHCMEKRWRIILLAHISRLKTDINRFVDGPYLDSY